MEELLGLLMILRMHDILKDPGSISLLISYLLKGMREGFHLGMFLG